MANYCFANFQKNHSNSVTNLQREANREFSDPKRYKNDVRLEKSDQNFYFAKCESWKNSIDDILEKYGIKKRKDSVVLTTTIYGFSEGWEDALYKSGKTQDEVEEQKKEFFKKCFEFENTRGKCINFIVHVDEAGQWHAHAATVPIAEVPIKKMKPVFDKDGNPKRLKNGRLKYDYDYQKDAEGNILKRYALNAKAIFGNRRKMSEEQTRFYESCGKPFGMERGECRIDDTEEDIVRHMSEVEYKAMKRAEEKAKEVRQAASDDALDIRMKARSVLKNANQEAKKIKSDAEEKAEKIISNAQEQAKEEAKRIVESGKKQVDDYFEEEKRKLEEEKAQNESKTKWIEEENKRLDEKRANIRKEENMQDLAKDIEHQNDEKNKPERLLPTVAYDYNL